MAYKSRASQLVKYGGRRHGLFGYYSPLIHPIRWSRVLSAHAKVCRILDYLHDHRSEFGPGIDDSIDTVYAKTWVLFNLCMDYLG